VALKPQHSKETEKSKRRYGWAKLEKLKTDCIVVNLKNAPAFSNFASIFMKTTF